MAYAELTEKIIASAIAVHRELGPGLLEGLYEAALCVEMNANGLVFEQQKAVDVIYKGEVIGRQRLDLLVENTVVLELKSVDRNDPIFASQILSYMKLGNYPVGLLSNFNRTTLKQGLRRFAL